MLLPQPDPRTPDQGYQRDAAEERQKDLFEVSALAEITKAPATKVIDELLNSAPEGVVGMEPPRVLSVGQGSRGTKPLPPIPIGSHRHDICLRKTPE